MSDNLPQIMARVKMMKLMKLIHQRSKNMMNSNPRSTNILHQVSYSVVLVMESTFSFSFSKDFD